MGEIAIREPHRLDSEQLKYISSTNFVPEHYRGKLPEIMACVATGRELGLGDMESLRSIYMVNGRPSLSAELMVKLARRHGHSINGSVSDGKATVVGTRVDTGDTMTVEWTREMAERAGLLSKATWKQYPEAMLWARAVSQLCRMLFPDVLSGISHTPDENQPSEEQRLEEQIVHAKAPAGDGPVDDVVDAEASEEEAEADRLFDETVKGPPDVEAKPKPATRRRAAK